MENSSFKDPFATNNTVIYLHLSGKSVTEINYATGMTVEEIESYISAFKKSREYLSLQSKKYNLLQYDEVVKLFSIDKLMTEISKETGIAYQMVLKYVENYTKFINDGKARKRTYYNCETERRLSVEEYIEFVNNDFSDSDIATYIGMSKDSVLKFKMRHEAEIKRLLNTSDNNMKEEVAVTIDEPTEPVEAPIVSITDSKAVEFTAMGNSALSVVNLLMKMKDSSSVSMKDISDLSNLLKDADISTYTLQKIS